MVYKSKRHYKKTLKRQMKSKKHLKLLKRNSKKIHKSKKYTKRKQHKGGYGPGAGPVGYSWDGSRPISWPGVSLNNNGVTQSNHYMLSNKGIPSGLSDPPEPTNQKGGRRKMHKKLRSRKRRHQKGGGSITALVPQDIVNVGRTVVGTLQDGVNSWKGTPENISFNPNPAYQPVIDKNTQFVGTYTPDITNIYSSANSSVANM